MNTSGGIVSPNLEPQHAIGRGKKRFGHRHERVDRVVRCLNPSPVGRCPRTTPTRRRFRWDCWVATQDAA